MYHASTSDGTTTIARQFLSGFLIYLTSEVLVGISGVTVVAVSDHVLTLWVCLPLVKN